MSHSTIQYLLRKYKLHPDTIKGQHFLSSDAILQKIVDTAEIQLKDHILEVGSGVGNLTALLAQKAANVTAVEVDERYRALLDALCAVNSNVSILYADILSLPFGHIQQALALTAGDSYKIVANIPYYLTSRFIAQSIRYPVPPDLIVLLIQKEVAERIVAKPGEHSKLSLSVQMYGEPDMIFTVPKRHFFPEPEVDSAVLRIKNVHAWNYSEKEQRVWQLISFGFSSKRKKLINNLMAGLQLPREQVGEVLEKAGLDSNVRAQNLRCEDWRSISRVLD